MNAKKLIVVMSAALLGLASCGGNGGNNELTRKEVEAKLDAIVAATPAAQTKLTAVNKTMDPSAVVGTYVFDAEAEYSHVKYTAAKTIKLSKEQSVSVTEIFAYAEGTNYVLGVVDLIDLTSKDKEAKNYVVTVAKSEATYMANFAKNGIDAFILTGREHWHNGGAGISAYLKRQDIIEAENYENRSDIVINGETITTGATEKGSYIKLADEKYSSTGEGNLHVEFDALYPDPKKPEKLHEPLLFEFENNLLTHWYNKKAGSYKGNEWVMTYGTADISAKATLAGEGSAEDVEKIFAAAIQTDAPHAEGDLASTRWN
ncbi:MAG: hypothetical protein SPI62_04160 [Candidatus Enteromonas sp.]|nr:hypothetical protein [Candidatus Enteromonas sp.]